MALSTQTVLTTDDLSVPSDTVPDTLSSVAQNRDHYKVNHVKQQCLRSGERRRVR